MLYFPGKIDKLIIQSTNQSIQVGGALFCCTIGNHVGYTLLYSVPVLENVENLCLKAHSVAFLAPKNNFVEAVENIFARWVSLEVYIYNAT